MDPSGTSLRSLLHDDCESFVKPFKGPVSIPTASSVASIDEVEETVAEAEAASIAAAVFAAELAKVAASNVPQDVTDGPFSHYPPDEDGGDLENNNDEVEDDIKVEVGDGDEDDDYLSDPENDLESMAIGLTKTTTTQTTTEAEAAAVAIAVVAAEVAKVASNVASASSRRGDEASSSSGSLVCDVGNSGNGSVDAIRKFNSTNFGTYSLVRRDNGAINESKHPANNVFPDILRTYSPLSFPCFSCSYHDVFIYFLYSLILFTPCAMSVNQK